MSPGSPDPQSFLPLTPPVFHVLLTLVGEEKHGYAILKEVGKNTGGRVQLSTGTLYAIIKRLLADGLIRETAGRRDGDDPRRRYYRVTAFGKRVAMAEAERLESLLAAARMKHLLPKPHAIRGAS